ncbi:hypothetical protein JCM8547_000691 [Rhodosporidiobolus lusitaniae]
MDQLDGNLHGALLAALALNLASDPPSSASSDASLLTASIEELTAASAAQGGYAQEGALQGQLLAPEQVESIVAFASYASSVAASSSDKAVDPSIVEQVLSLLEQLPGWEIETAVGVQASSSHPPSSRLAFSLCTAALSLSLAQSSSSSTLRPRVLSTLSSTHAALVSQLSSSGSEAAARSLTHVLPALEGLSRGYDASPFVFSPGVEVPSFSLEDKEGGVEPFLLPWTTETDAGRAVLSTFEVYRSSSSGAESNGISPATALLAELARAEAYFSSFLLSPTPSSSDELWAQERWTTLISLSRAPSVPSSLPSAVQKAAEQTARRAMEVWEDAVGRIGRAERARVELDGGEGEGEGGGEGREQQEEEEVRRKEVTAEGAGEVLGRALRLATLSTLLSPPSSLASLSSSLLSILEPLLHPSSTSIDDSLQILALESLQLVASSSSSGELLPTAVEVVKRFVLSGALRASEDPAEENRVRDAAGRCWNALISASPSPSSARSTAIQTLLNHVAAAERGGYVVEGEEDGGRREAETAAANAVGVVERLGRESGEVQLIRLLLSTLSHHLITATSLLVLSSCLSSLLSLSPLAPDSQTFRDVLRAICSAASSSTSPDEGEEKEEQKYSAVLTALSKMAEIAARRSEGEREVGEGFLGEVLGLFGRKAAEVRGKGKREVGGEQRAQTLLSLVPILSTFLTTSSSFFFSPSTHLPSSLSALFRRFWYTCLLNGFLSPSSSPMGQWGKLSEWQQEALREVARRSPTLVNGVGGEAVEMFGALEGVLKSGEWAMSTNALRADLSSSLPSQSSAARSLPAPHAVFLLTTLRLETLRAQSGSLSPFFAYLAVPALNGGDATGEALKSVGERVLATYQAHLSAAVTSHALEPGAYKEVREILLCTADAKQRTRETALRYLDNLLSSFPSLVCDLGVVSVMLEMLTVVRRACASEYLDEYTPTYSFPSPLASFTLTLTDDYPTRNRILRSLHASVRAWLLAGITRSPLEMQGLLQEYVDGAGRAVGGTGREGEGEGYRSGMGGVGGEEEMGKSVALELVKTPPSNGKYAALPAWGDWIADASSSFARTFAAKSFFGGEAQRSGADPSTILASLERLSASLDAHKLPYKLPELRDLFYRGAASLIASPNPSFAVLHLVVALPVRLFTEASVAVGQEVWTWVADARPELEGRVVGEVVEAWKACGEKGQGLFSRAVDPENPLNQETSYTPTDKPALTREYLLANRVFAPMLSLLEFLSSRFQAFRYRNKELVMSCVGLVERCLEEGGRGWSTHSLSRELRFRFLSFGFCLLQGSRLESVAEFNLRQKLYDGVLSWFSMVPRWSFGSNRIQLKSDLQAIDELASVVAADVPAFDNIASASDERTSSLPGRISISSAREQHRLRQQLVKHLLVDEADRLKLWLNPLQDSKRGPLMSGDVPPVEELRKLVRFAWKRDPKVVVFLPDRFKASGVKDEVCRLVRGEPEKVQDVPEALQYFVEDGLSAEARKKLRQLLFWAPVPVPSALRFLHPRFGNDPILLQYALRVLEHHPVEVTFFYIPQVVQALRTDDSGYAERFIFETSKISQHFCHQIIWNMKANAYRGDDAEEPDPMKPTLDRMVDMIVESLSGDAKDFYQREFSFFDEVTSISGKLKPFIKASKPEKKAKIDEEMEKIKVDPGVYLPSNPDGVLVDINRKSGRPLQSHAKAPFMATFKVRRTRTKVSSDDLEAQDALIDVEDAENEQKEEYDTWQSAIFKVGDDCRQDVLALQIIAIHKNVFNALGLDLLVTPYRVTATGPGCGVIDVIPNATSRDEMGRAKINDLQSFFVMKYGPTDSVEFQRARTNFIQSMAAYSLLCYIVQIKDRHNGNIMIDGRGCLTHIDFGFLFDIGPGGVKFEPNSFKLSHEMVVLMGGRDSVGFRQFRELTVKAFLSARYYAQTIVDTTHLMLAAEFPSFKGEGTIERLKGRFRLDLSEREAAKFMVDIINDACENKRSIVYDEFQRVTNGIPYTR